MTAYGLSSAGQGGVSAFFAREGRSAGAQQHIANLHNPTGLPLVEADTLGLIAPTSEADLLSKGSRASYTRQDYFLPATAKAPFVDGPLGFAKGFGPMTATAMVRGPVDGLFPRDEWQVECWIKSVGEDMTTNTGDGVVWDARTAVRSDFVSLKIQNGVLYVTTRGWTASIALFFALTPLLGDVPADTWTCVTVTYRESTHTLTAILGNNVRSASLAGFTMPVHPFGGSDQLYIGHHPEVGGGLPGYHVAYPHFRRYARTFGQTLIYEGPTITVDADDDAGAFPTGCGGILAQYPGWRGQGFDGAVGDGGVTPTSIRDQAIAATTADGMNLVRLEWPLNHVTITGTTPSFVYNYAALDEQMDAFDGCDFHVTLGHCPPILNADPEGMPSSNADMAIICSAVLGHMKARYPGRIRHITLWNEPYLVWEGTVEQFTTMWGVVQAKLTTDHPDLPSLGGPDDGWINYMTATIDFAEANGRPFGGVFLHNYEDTPIGFARELKLARDYLDAAGFTSAPIGVTEWNNDQGWGNERHSSAASLAKRRNRHRDEFNAALSYAKLWELVEAGGVIGAFTRLAVIDHGTGGIGDSNEREMGLFVNADPLSPMAVYAAFQAFWKHAGDRVAATCNFPYQRALASKTAEGVITLSYGNFRPWDGRELIGISLKWAGLPAEFTWREWRLDHRDAQDGRLVLVAGGDETDLPGRTELAAMGVGCIQITPA